jgi:hypothetical protein
MNTTARDRPPGFESKGESVHVLTAKLLGLRMTHDKASLINESALPGSKGFHRAIVEGTDPSALGDWTRTLVQPVRCAELSASSI